MKIYDAKNGKALEWSERYSLEDLKKFLKVSASWVDTYENAVDEMISQNTNGLTDKGNTIIDSVACNIDYDKEKEDQKEQLRREIFDMNFVENWNRYSEKGVRYDGTIGTLWEIVS